MTLKESLGQWMGFWGTPCVTFVDSLFVFFKFLIANRTLTHSTCGFSLLKTERLKKNENTKVSWILGPSLWLDQELLHSSLSSLWNGGLCCYLPFSLFLVSMLLLYSIGSLARTPPKMQVVGNLLSHSSTHLYCDSCPVSLSTRSYVSLGDSFFFTL